MSKKKYLDEAGLQAYHEENKKALGKKAPKDHKHTVEDITDLASSYVPSSGPSTITGDMGTITFDPDGTGEHHVSECGIEIKMDDTAYAKIEPACIDLRYYSNSFSMSAEEGYICAAADKHTKESYVWAGGITITGPYGNIKMNTTDDDEGNVYIKLASKDDPDNYYTHIGPSFIHFQGDANYFGMWVEDGLMDMGNDEYISSMGLGWISLNSPDWSIKMTAGAGSASGVPAICVTNKSNWNNYEYTFPEKTGTIALTNDIESVARDVVTDNGLNHIYVTSDETELTGHTLEGDIDSYYYSQGIELYDCDNDVSNYLYFPKKTGTIALTNDFKTINGQSIIGSGDITISGGSSDKKYQHDIYIMPGNSSTGGVYIYLTLNINQSSKISSVADLCSVLYNRGNNVQQQAVSATGKAGASSTSFNGFIIGVWASSTSTLNVVYVTTAGTVSTTSYSASMFTAMRDTVN